METEIWDILDADGRPTGRTQARCTGLPPGDFHLVVHIWFVDENGWTLIQKRAANLDWMPGAWAATGGSVIQGESSRAGAVRETAEELGLSIAPDRLRLLGRLTRRDNISDIWVVRGERAEFGPLRLDRDVAEARWVSWPDLLRMAERGEFVDYGDEYTALVAGEFARRPDEAAKP